MKNLLIMTLALTVCALAALEPTGISMIFRHGARGPAGKDWDSTWGNMYGELTSVGMRQQYLRGAYLQKLYPNLFSKYDPNGIYVRSTDSSRTIMSAYSILDGLFQGKGPVFSDTYPVERAIPLYNVNFSDPNRDVLPNRYQAVPIHIVDTTHDDLLLSVSSLICPLSKKLLNDQQESQAFVDLVAKFNSTLAELSKIMNLTQPMTFQSLNDLGDALIADDFEGKSLPGNIDLNSELGKNITFLSSYAGFYIEAGTPLQRQLFSMNLLNQFKNDLEEILNGSTTTIKLYGAHDSTLIPILAVMGIATHECIYKNFFENGNDTSCYFPKFASALRFEVWKNETDKDSSEIRVYFDEVEQNICNTQNGHCSWRGFKDMISNYTQDKGMDYYLSTCKSISSSPTNESAKHGIKEIPDGSYIGLKYVVYALSGIAGMLFIGIIYLVGKKRDIESRAEGYMM